MCLCVLAGRGGGEGLKRTHALTDLCWLAVSGGGEDGGCAVLVITDGTPDSAEKVERVIIDATKSMRQDADLSISFIQVRPMDRPQHTAWRHRVVMVLSWWAVCSRAGGQRRSGHTVVGAVG